MKKFTGVLENYKNELLKNKIINKSELFITIECDFCNYRDEYKCKNKVSEKEEWWLSSEDFILKGWIELITPDKKGIACPNCKEKWNNGQWYEKK